MLEQSNLFYNQNTHQMKSMLKEVLEAEIHHSLEAKHSSLIELLVLVIELLYPNALDHTQYLQIPRPAIKI